jgi:uncharacterized protein DUF2637
MRRPAWPGWPRPKLPAAAGPLEWDRTAVVTAIPTAIVATVAGVVSYSHIVALALRVGQDASDAHLLPVSVDGLIVGGSVIILAGSPLGWLGVALGVAATLFANVEAGLPHGPLNAAVSAWPALAFSVASFLLERWLKAQAGRGGRGGRDDGRPVGGDGRDVTANGQCTHGVARSAEEAVTLAYLHGRDCLDETPSQRQLAASFGVHRTKVAELVAPHNGHVPAEPVP